MIMGNYLRTSTVRLPVMATNSSRPAGSDRSDDADAVPGIAHPTVVPTNFERDDEE